MLLECNPGTKCSRFGGESIVDGDVSVAEEVMPFSGSASGCPGALAATLLIMFCILDWMAVMSENIGSMKKIVCVSSLFYFFLERCATCTGFGIKEFSQ